MKPHDGPTLVVNADNLTALDLGAVVADHLASGAAMTQAVHHQSFHMPFGEIELAEDGTISAYREKPTYEILISSAITVVSPEAAELVRRGEFINLPLLANRVLEAGMTLRGYRHDAAWIDVNDLGARSRADQLLHERAVDFEAVGIGRHEGPEATGD
jgi:NDP-sugar pyrophosphorylase family protein